MLKEQRFGVEVEMTGISRKKAADVLAEVFGAIAGEPDGTCYHTRIINDENNPQMESHERFIYHTGKKRQFKCSDG